jgi:uncharacterized membrane protein YfcA
VFGIAVLFVAILAGGIASIAGFGVGSLLTPLLASQYGMKTAVAAVSVPHLIATALRLWRLRHDVDRRVLFTFGAVNAAGSLAGALVHSRVDNPILAMVLGILLVFAGITGSWDRMRFGRTAAWLAGLASGVFGGLVAIRAGSAPPPCLAFGVRHSSRHQQESGLQSMPSGYRFISRQNPLGFSRRGLRFCLRCSAE